MNTEVLQNLAPNVAIVAIFIWYLVKRDKAMETIVDTLAEKLDKLARVIASLEHRIASIEKTRVEEKE